MIVVSDASPLNLLVRIEHVEVLPKLFGAVVIPPAVERELSHANTPDDVRAWMALCPDWLSVQNPTRIDATLELNDPGELEAISLAIEIHADLVLVDDRKARRAAIQRGLSITGAIGVLESAAAAGYLDLPGAFERIKATDFIIADSVLRAALERDILRKRSNP